LAAKQPDRVDRLVCIGGVGTTLFSPGPAEGIRLLMDFLAEPDKPALRRWLRSMVYDQTLVTEQLLEERWAQVNEPGVIESMKSLYNPAAIAKVARGEVSFDLADVTAPTLLFWGSDDRVSPVDMSIMPMRLMPDSKLNILLNCGYWVMIEKKEALERQAREFLLRGRSCDQAGRPAWGLSRRRAGDRVCADARVRLFQPVRPPAPVRPAGLTRPCPCRLRRVGSTRTDRPPRRT